jgi:hypothetical protein
MTFGAHSKLNSISARNPNLEKRIAFLEESVEILKGKVNLRECNVNLDLPDTDNLPQGAPSPPPLTPIEDLNDVTLELSATPETLAEPAVATENNTEDNVEEVSFYLGAYQTEFVVRSDIDDYSEQLKSLRVSELRDFAETLEIAIPRGANKVSIVRVLNGSLPHTAIRYKQLMTSN